MNTVVSSTKNSRATITLAMLREKEACEEQVALFEKTFGESVVVTVARAKKYANKFNWNWAASNLLSAAARADYERAKATARADYERATAPAWADYERAIAPARTDFRRAETAAWADYKRATAALFAHAFIQQSIGAVKLSEVVI